MSVAIPTVTAAQMAEVDRIMMDELGVDVLQLMEAAGLAVAEAARQRLGGDVAGKRVLLLAGTGGNGGDALVAARHLHARSADPTVVLSKPVSGLPPVTAHQCQLVEAFGVSTFGMAEAEQIFSRAEYDLIVDGLLGFSGRGNPRGAVAELIRLANDHPAPILAIDLPSGLDATSGVPGAPCIRAAATVTLALPKTGLAAEAAREMCGEITVADIGVPASVVEKIGVEVSPALFSRSSSLRWNADG